MMLNSVPRLTGSCRGTGIVMVVPSVLFCMIRWLPRWRAAAKPCCSRIEQTSVPARTRSLPNRNLNLGYEYFAVQPAGNLGSGCGLKEEGKRLDKIGARFFDGCSLAGDVQLRAQCHESVIFAFNDRGHVPGVRHVFSLRVRVYSGAARGGRWRGSGTSSIHVGGMQRLRDRLLNLGIKSQ